MSSEYFAAYPAHPVPDLVLTRGTPPTNGGLPASKPGLDAGARELGSNVALNSRPMRRVFCRVREPGGQKYCARQNSLPSGSAITTTTPAS